MINKLKTSFLVFFYKLFIVKILVLNKKDNTWIDRLEVFAKINIHTDKGDFVFIFKQDRRLAEKQDHIPIKTYIAELDIPYGVTLKDNSIADKFVAVIKVALFTINPDIMAKVLMDIYLKAFLSK